MSDITFLQDMDTFSMLYLCLSSLSKSVGIAIFVNLYIAGSNRFNGSLCSGSTFGLGGPEMQVILKTQTGMFIRHKDTGTAKHFKTDKA